MPHCDALVEQVTYRYLPLPAVTCRYMPLPAVTCRYMPHCDALVEQALLVSNELIRVAILWGEMWHEALEQARGVTRDGGEL